MRPRKTGPDHGTALRVLSVVCTTDRGPEVPDRQDISGASPSPVVGNESVQFVP